MFKLLKKAAMTLSALVVVLGSPAVLAAAAGQIETGNFYTGRNDTKNSAFGDPVTADPCDAITLKMRLHNPGPSALTNVNVRATIPSGEGTSFSSVATVTAADGDPQVVTDSVAIQVSKSAKINYVPGSTQLLDANGGAISTLPDGALQSGVNIGDVGVSIEQKRFVQFKLKLDCPTPPEKPPEKPEMPPTTPVTPKKPTAPSAPAASSAPSPTSIPSTGPVEVISGFLGTGSLGYGIRQWLMSRRRLGDVLNQ